MAVRIGMCNGKEWVVEGDVNEIAASMASADPATMIEIQIGDEKRRVWIFGDHVASVAEEWPSKNERAET